MSWERRPREDEPRMIQRFVQSGRHEGGEDFAEVLFVCNDQPAETKRVATLDMPPGEADDHWQMMADQDIEDLFRRSERA